MRDSMFAKVEGSSGWTRLLIRKRVQVFPERGYDAMKRSSSKTVRLRPASWVPVRTSFTLETAPQARRSMSVCESVIDSTYARIRPRVGLSRGRFRARYTPRTDRTRRYEFVGKGANARLQHGIASAGRV